MDQSNVVVAAPDGSIDSGVQPVASTTAWQPVGRIICLGRSVVLQGLVGAGGALGRLKVTQAARVGADHNDLAVDADFATGTAAVPVCLAAKDGGGHVSPQTTPAGGSFQLRLADGAAEYAVYAMAATTPTTLQLVGSVWGHK